MFRSNDFWMWAMPWVRIILGYPIRLRLIIIIQTSNHSKTLFSLVSRLMENIFWELGSWELRLACQSSLKKIFRAKQRLESNFFDITINSENQSRCPWTIILYSIRIVLNPTPFFFSSSRVAKLKAFCCKYFTIRYVIALTFSHPRSQRPL